MTAYTLIMKQPYTRDGKGILIKVIKVCEGEKEGKGEDCGTIA
jgi:hypothetical protein